jgi:hypothetical protein
MKTLVELTDEILAELDSMKALSDPYNGGYDDPGIGVPPEILTQWTAHKESVMEIAEQIKRLSKNNDR